VLDSREAADTGKRPAPPEETETTMRLPAINWTKIAEHLAASDPYAAVLMADGSIHTREGETLMASSEPVETADRHARYEAWCRRGGRAIQPVAAAH
jgi:hypothetical protein